MSETLDFISFVPWTFFAMIANVYILYRIVRHFLFKPVKEILEKRQMEVDNIYIEADKLKEEAANAKNQYNHKLEQVQAEASAVMVEAVDSARRQEAEIISEAKEKAHHIRNKAGHDIEQMQRKAARELQNDISQISLDIARKVIEQELKETDHNDLIEKAINHFSEDLI